MQMADAIKKSLEEFAENLSIRESSFGLSVQKGVRYASVVGHPHSRVGINFWAQGVEYARGEAELEHVGTAIIAFLVEEAPLRNMTSRFPWFEPLKGASAHEQGATTFVNYKWSSIEEGWRGGMSHYYPLASRWLVPLIQGASTRPELRQLFPFTSHFSLHFSRTTGYPFSRDCPFAEPVGKGLYGKGLFWRIKRLNRSVYRVTSADGTVMCAKVDVVSAVDALVAALPPNCGPAVNGTAEW